MARRREGARLLVLGTYRPVELILRAHPLKQAKALSLSRLWQSQGKGAAAPAAGPALWLDHRGL
jgi:hypothetical protein